MASAALFLRIGALLGGLAVALGAFGAHGLKERIDAEMLAVFETGVRYHFYHALALIAIAAGSAALWESQWTAAAAWAWFAGVIIFSGSLYLLVVTGTRWLGAITPIGGVAFIIGWVCLGIAAGALTR
ncbi:MAG: DUF423 domain-containing protein [Candidatus Hydrogenedentota bacterium]